MDNFKKRFENCIQEDGRYLANIILKLNHLVWHVLSFNFVQINVNLLEKQLSTVYSKDVRFPWVTCFCLLFYVGVELVCQIKGRTLS
jgi:hypothetical protein